MGDFKELVGEDVLHVLTEEVGSGKMKKTEVKKLALGLGDRCHVVFTDREQMPTFDTSAVLDEILDAWMRNYAYNYQSKEARVEEFIRVLENQVKRFDLVA